MASTVENIKSRLSIVDVVGGFVKLEKAGVNLKARCPFHNERTASFYVSPVRQSFHCFGCNKGGDMFTFIEEIEVVSFQEALVLLAGRAGVTIERTVGERHAQGEKERLRQIVAEAIKYYAACLENNKLAQEYLTGRGVNDETIKRFEIGFAPNDWRTLAVHLKKLGFQESDGEKAGLLIASEKGYYDRFRNRIMFPVFDASGQPSGFSGRIMPGSKLPSGEEPAKYINTPQTAIYDKSRAVYGLSVAKKAIREFDRCILVEGQMDTILSSQAGVAEVVAVSGTALTPEHIVMIKRFTDNLIVVLDSDDAGFKAAARSIRMAYASSLFVKALLLPSGKDPADFILSNADEWKKLVEKSEPFVDFAIASIDKKHIDSRAKAKKIREFIYPYIRLIAVPLEQEEAFRRIANSIDTGVDAVRSDYQLWLQSTPDSGELRELEQVNLDARESQKIQVTRSGKIFDRIRGTALWQLTKSEPVITGEAIKQNVLKTISELPGGALSRPDAYMWDRVDENKTSLIFEAESYYHGSPDLQKDIDRLINDLATEILKERLDFAVSLLRKAERSNEKDSEELLKICNELSRAFASRQSK